MSGLVILILRLALTAALYGFLAWAFVTLWRDLKRQSELLATRQAPRMALLNREAGLDFHFNRSQIRIGRDLACECCLDDPTVSMQHARLSYHHNQWWLEDLGSTNGTFLNGLPVPSPVVVTRGDEIGVGQLSLNIMIGGGGDDFENNQSARR